MTNDKNLSDPARFQPKVVRNEKTVATIMTKLCKGCGECVVKCPVKCIDWDPVLLGTTGEPCIRIDMSKCIGCETCELICPDFAIQITNLKK